MWRLSRMLRRHAMRKSVQAGDHRWFSLWIVLAGAQLIHRVMTAKPVIERFELKRGDTIVISDLGRPDN
jgi:hypothetical protein